MDPHNTSGLTRDCAARILGRFLAAANYGYTLEYGVKKIFLTGVTPLLLSGYTNGFNILDNVSYLPNLSGLCGFTRSEVSEALEVVCDDEAKRSHYLDELAYHANGYLFATDKDTSPVFNTQTTIDYLNVISPQSRFLTGSADDQESRQSSTTNHSTSVLRRIRKCPNIS